MNPPMNSPNSITGLRRSCGSEIETCFIFARRRFRVHYAAYGRPMPAAEPIPSTPAADGYRMPG
jgi:hypothetical protein